MIEREIRELDGSENLGREVRVFKIRQRLPEFHWLLNYYVSSYSGHSNHLIHVANKLTYHSRLLLQLLMPTLKYFEIPVRRQL